MDLASEYKISNPYERLRFKVFIFTHSIKIRTINMPKKKALPYILFISILLLSSCSTKRLVKKAYKSYEIGEYYASADLFTKAIRKVKKRDQKAEMAFLMADSYRRIQLNKKADTKYVQAEKLKYDNPQMYLDHAEVQLRLDKLKDARKSFKTYLEYDSTNVVALNGLLACDSIPAWNKVKTRYNVKKMDDLSEKRASDFSPSFVGEGYDVLYFTSTREGLAQSKTSKITGQRSVDIFMTRLDSKNEWVDVEPVQETAINSEFDDGVTSFSPDGKKMYFTRARYEDGAAIGTELFVSDRSGAKWSEPKKITFFTDSLADTLVLAHPAIAADGSKLYFVSDLKGGYGGTDIWMVKNFAGKWSLPENLGPEINTPGDEKFPYVREDGSLYFSSNGQPGLGGLDIYHAIPIEKAEESDEQHWEVYNMLSPINSAADDFGITFAGMQERGFFSSNRKDTKGYDNLYSFVRPELEYVLSGTIKDEKSGDPLSDAIIKLIGDDGTNVKIPTKKDGSYSKKVNKDANFVFLVTNRSYLNQKGEFSTLNMKESKTYTFDFNLVSIKKPIRLDNIHYEFGSAELTEDAKKNISENLVHILKNNPNITIELSAHTDYVGDNASNQTLSQARAKSVVDFLVQHGIQTDRLVPVGYGEEQPVLVDKEMAKTYGFLKVNDVLTEDFIKRLSVANQEIANQINRRTELKVLSTNYKPKRPARRPGNRR